MTDAALETYSRARSQRHAPSSGQGEFRTEFTDLKAELRASPPEEAPIIRAALRALLEEESGPDGQVGPNPPSTARDTDKAGPASSEIHPDFVR